MSQAKKAFIGSLTLTFSRLSERLLGLVSTLITARLLLPEDFGLVAIAMIVIGFFSIMAMTGSNQYIIQKESVSEQDLDTAWTLDLLMKSSIFIVLIIIAPLISEYYDDERLTDVIYVLSTMLLFSAFSNPALMLKHREQTYRPIFILDVARKVFAISTVITIAYMYRNYWAMVCGHIVSNAVGFVGSYIVVRYRPKISFHGLKEQWLFSKWMLSKGFMGYFRSQVDTILVSHFYGTSQVGGYHVTKYIATMPGSQIITPATSPLLATFSRTKNKPDEFEHQVKLTLLVLQFLALPMTAFLFVFSQPLVGLLLGDKWLNFSHIFAILALLTLPLAIGNVVSQILTSKRKVKALFYYDLLSLIAVCFALLLVRDFALPDFAWVRVMMDYLAVLLLFSFSLYKFTKIKILTTLGAFIVTATAAFAGAYAVKLAIGDLSSLILTLLAVGISYLALWLIFTLVAYKLYFRKTPEGVHLQFLVASLVSSVMLKCKVGKHKTN